MSRPTEVRRAIRILTEARVLISDKRRWTTGCTARDVDRRPVPVNSHTAVVWCARGAIEKVGATAPWSSSIAYRAIYQSTSTSLVSVNDKGGHKRVLALLDRAIARLQKELDS